VVGRPELRRRLWTSEIFVDLEQGLNAAVRRLHEALGDSADSPRFIETLPKRGYRFIGTIAPELNPANYAPRVRTPTLMINGRWDSVLPYETAQRPLFRLLG
jgi:DNA-binding winged helix-turn-helix (wHTH) protein